jgi:hypothetical protein
MTQIDTQTPFLLLYKWATSQHIKRERNVLGDCEWVLTTNPKSLESKCV